MFVISAFCTAVEGWERSVGTDRAKNEEILHSVNEERNILHTIKREEVDWIGHISRRNCLLKHIT